MAGLHRKESHEDLWCRLQKEVEASQFFQRILVPVRTLKVDEGPSQQEQTERRDANVHHAVDSQETLTCTTEVDVRIQLRDAIERDVRRLCPGVPDEPGRTQHRHGEYLRGERREKGITFDHDATSLEPSSSASGLRGGALTSMRPSSMKVTKKKQRANGLHSRNSGWPSVPMSAPNQATAMLL